MTGYSSWTGPMLVLALASISIGCTETECATPNYRRAECRVLAENGFARLRSAEGIELRFHEPPPAGVAPTDDRAPWTVDGIFFERGPGIRARVAHMGRFSISLRNTSPVDRVVALELGNIHPAAEVETSDAVVEQWREGLARGFEVSVPAQSVTWVGGGLPEQASCAGPVRVAVLSDVQTNPTQFGVIMERLGVEAALAAEDGELLVGVVMAGDLTESASEEEFRAFTDLLEKAPVPFALTPGNHDVYSSGLPHFNHHFGPGNYDFDVCGVHVVMLDTGSGAIADSVFARLPALLDKGDAGHSIMAMHHPPHPAHTGAGWSREDLALMTLGEFAHNEGDLILAGHAHMLEDFRFSAAGRELREIIAGTAGAWQGAGQPIYGYVRLTIDPDPARAIDACFVEVPAPGALPHVDTPASTLPPCPPNEETTK